MNVLDWAVRLVSELERLKKRIVFAESCTGGLVAATVTSIPGASRVCTGSLVTYVDEAKIGWLGVDRQLIATHTAVSAEVASAMAQGALDKTPWADLAVSVTGHLGPDAPPELDGVVYSAIVDRSHGVGLFPQKQIALRSEERAARQTEAASEVLEFLITSLPLFVSKGP